MIVMIPKQQRLALFLTYSGTLPLIACALDARGAVVGIQVAHIAIAYGAVIISFLCGIHWAAHLFFSEKCPGNLLVSSNVVALLAWLTLLIEPFRFAAILQSLCFLYLLILDAKLRDAGIIQVWFYALRRNATLIVIIAMLMIAGFT